jgi:hypothetical protein
VIEANGDTAMWAGGALAFCGAVYELLRRYLRRQDAREERSEVARAKHDDKQTELLGALVEQGRTNSANMAQLAATVGGVVVEMRELGRDMAELGALVRDRTPIAGVPITAGDAVPGEMTGDGETPIEVPRTRIGGRYGRRGAGGKET